MSTNESALTNSNYYEGLNAKNIVLGLQHLIAMFGATVLVPILTGLNPSVALFSAGIGTLTFHAVTGGKVPVFLGSSFAFIAYNRSGGRYIRRSAICSGRNHGCRFDLRIAVILGEGNWR